MTSCYHLEMLGRIGAAVKALVIAACMAYIGFGIYYPMTSPASLAATRPKPSPASPPASARSLWWPALRGLDPASGAASVELRESHGKPRRVPGFMVPLEDSAQSVTEFLLVPYVGACVHTPPPPANQIVFVTMAGGSPARVEWWRPVWVEGEFRIERSGSPYGAAAFRILAVKVERYQD